MTKGEDARAGAHDMETFQADDGLSSPRRGAEQNSINAPDSTSAPNDPDSDDTVENYDDLELDPDTLVASSRKTTTTTSSTHPLPNATSNESLDALGDAMPQRKSSIQITLARTDRKGRYILTADDPEVKEILRRGIEREEELKAASPQKSRRLRDLVFTRQFTTFDRQNPTSAESPFFGFFVLFWISCGLMFVQVAMHNWRDYGSILGSNQVMKLMFSRDVVVLGLTDGAMFLLCFEGYFMQVLVQKGYIDWNRTGWILQNVWQAAYLGSLVGWTYFRDWPWTHSMFAVLHALVFVMKQHSWAFYNGYLSAVYKRRALLERKLHQLSDMEPITSPPESPGVTRQPEFLTTGTEVNDLGDNSYLVNRRPSIKTRTSTNFSTEKSDVASVAAAIESTSALNAAQMTTFQKIITAEIADLTHELQGKAPVPSASYPSNLTLPNLTLFIFFPTLVYELAYPRQQTRNWTYIAEKTLATFGVLGVMQVISQAFIYPTVTRALALKATSPNLQTQLSELPFIISDILFPLLLEQLLTWYLIWECILNVLAELTRFADRGFYGAWWNSRTWDQYARDWNRPVHAFLLRHVYHSSISSLKVGRGTATFLTFGLSALVHEMVMAVLFQKVRGYLFCMQLLQLPLIWVSRSRVFKGHATLGNAHFWIGLFIGPSVLTALYLVI